MRVWLQMIWNIVLKLYTMYDIFYGFWSSESFSPHLLQLDQSSEYLVLCSTEQSHTGLEQQEGTGTESTVLLLCNLDKYLYSDEQNAVFAFDLISHLTL